MAAATFQHRAFKVGDAKDINMNGQSIESCGQITNINGQEFYFGVLSMAVIRIAAGATGSGNYIEIGTANVFFPIQKSTVGAPAYVKGGMYFDTTLNKLRIGGATGWETVGST